MLNLKDKTLNLIEDLTQWEKFYNNQESHSSLQGKTPWEKYREVQHQVPIYEQIRQLYTQKKFSHKLQFYLMEEAFSVLTFSGYDTYS